MSVHQVSKTSVEATPSVIYSLDLQKDAVESTLLNVSPYLKTDPQSPGNLICHFSVARITVFLSNRCDFPRANHGCSSSRFLFLCWEVSVVSEALCQTLHGSVQHCRDRALMQPGGAQRGAHHGEMANYRAIC